MIYNGYILAIEIINPITYVLIWKVLGYALNTCVTT